MVYSQVFENMWYRKNDNVIFGLLKCLFLEGKKLIKEIKLKKASDCIQPWTDLFFNEKIYYI